MQDVKVAIYARYSSDNQRDASIADQLRVCRAFAERQGWTIARSTPTTRCPARRCCAPGFQALMRDALNRRFDVVLAESLDRFSRDQEDTAGLFKRLTFAGVNIVTLAEGDITHLHIGFKGTMNALFLKDLAEKTHRGLRGRIEDGKSGGGLCYGYRVVKALQRRQPSRRASARSSRPRPRSSSAIFRDFIAGVSPKQIAQDAEPRRRARPVRRHVESEHDLRQRASAAPGILNNELYVGRLVWNRLRYVKNPDTGKRVSRLNPQPSGCEGSPGAADRAGRPLDRGEGAAGSARGTRCRPRARIGAAKRPQVPVLRPDEVRRSAAPGSSCRLQQPARVLRRARPGTCDNQLTIRRDEVEARVLAALQEKLLRQDLFEEFCDEFTREMNRLRMEHRAGRVGRRARDRAHRSTSPPDDPGDHGRLRRRGPEGRVERHPGAQGRLQAQLAARGRAAATAAPGHGRTCTARR